MYEKPTTPAAEYKAPAYVAPTPAFYAPAATYATPTATYNAPEYKVTVTSAPVYAVTEY